MTSKTIEEEFRKVSKNMQIAAQQYYTSAMENIAKVEKGRSSADAEQNLKNAAAVSLALAAELLLKANLIYDEFRKDQKFIQETDTKITIEGRTVTLPAVGTNDWRAALSGEINSKDINIIKSPINILKMIKENNPNDPRNALTNALTISGKKPNGHSLYAYFQLLDPVVKSLINLEYNLYSDSNINYILYALLMEDICDVNDNKKMTQNIMLNLDKNSDAFISKRYASISKNGISDSDLTFLKEFVTCILNVTKYRFPELSDVDELSYQNMKSNTSDAVLNYITQYNLSKKFNENERENIEKFISNENFESKKTKLFINLCVYLKNCTNEQFSMVIDFSYEQLRRIYNYLDVVESFQPFDYDECRLKDNPFFTEEKIGSIVRIIKEKNQERADKIRMEILSKIYDKLISTGVIVDQEEINEIIDGKIPIMISGASVSNWYKIEEANQDENVRILMQVLVDQLDPDKAYIVTGGTNHGVERETHKSTYLRNLIAKNNDEKQMDVLGTLTEEAGTSNNEIDPNTITHAMILQKDGKNARTWDDIDVFLNLLKEKNGFLIAIGGGQVVEKLINEAYVENIDMHLMENAPGASKNKCKSYVGEGYNFKSVEELISKLYKKNQKLFKEDFSLEKIQLYIEQAKDEISRESQIIEESIQVHTQKI